MFQTKRGPKVQDASEKVWFIILENKQEGPYSILDLKKEARFNPDTLIWKKGFKEWTAARNVAEIQEVFSDELPSQETQEPHQGKALGSDLGQESQATLTMQQDPYQLILWILVVLLIIIYAFYQLLQK